MKWNCEMNDVVKSNASAGALAGYQNMLGAIANVAQTAHVSRGGQFLRLQKTKDWVYGADDTEPSPQTLWAVNLFSLEHGYTCWDRRSKKEGGDTSGGPIEERMVAANVKLEPIENMPDHSKRGGEWTKQVSMELIGAVGPDTGIRVIYKVNSGGGLQEVEDMLIKIGTDFNPETPVPLIKLGATTFKSRTYGQVVKPVLTIARWVENDPRNIPDPAAEQEPAGDLPEDDDQPEGETHFEAHVETDDEREERELNEKLAAIAAKKKSATAAAPAAEAGTPVRRRNR